MIELRYFEESDFQQLINWIDSPDFLLQWSGPNLKYPLNHEQLKDYILNANKKDATTFTYAILDKESKKVIGHISLTKVDYKEKTARISKVLIGDSNSRGKGICPMAVEKILRIAFDKLKLQKIGLVVFDFNTSAIACYEKSGFLIESYKKDARKIGDEYWSLFEMSIEESNWRKIV